MSDEQNATHTTGRGRVGSTSLAVADKRIYIRQMLCMNCESAMGKKKLYISFESKRELSILDKCAGSTFF